MRIVFLANPSYDYLQDVVYHGLVSILGPESVVEYPPLDRYHSPVPADADYPQLWFDFPQPPRPRLREAVAEADAVVIGSLRSGIRDLVDEVLSVRQRPATAFLDGEDDSFVRAVRSSVDVYCKREIVRTDLARLGREALRRVHRRLRKRREIRDPLADPVSAARATDRGLLALPLAWIGPLPPRRPPQYDVTFALAPTSAERAVIRRDLLRLASEGIRVRMLEPGERLDWASYIEMLTSSRIAVSARGAGFDTYRYWEIPAAGAVLLAETPKIVIPNNFVDGREAVFAPAERLVSRIPELLAAGTEEIAQNGRDRLMSAHTSVHRAQAVLDALAAPVR